MQSINRRIKTLEQRRAAIGNLHCPVCGSYLGQSDDLDVTLVRAGEESEPPCYLCGHPISVTLRLGRRVIADYATVNMNHDAEIDLLMEQMREIIEE